MFIAKKNSGKLIDIETAIDSDELEYFCPCCGGEVIIKNGLTNISHFAHKTLKDCDSFTQDTSDWHKDWQERFPLNNREVGLPQGKPIHRADVLAYGFVIEFQHSRITREEFNLRNSFYTSIGKKVIWIFDMREVYHSGNMSCYDEFCDTYRNGGKYSWSHPWRIFSDWNPIVDTNIMVFFQISDYDFDDEDEPCPMERVTWAINEDDETNMKRFITSYKIGNLTELMDYMASDYKRRKRTVK